MNYKIIAKEDKYYIDVPFENNNVISEFFPVRKFDRPYWITTDAKAVEAFETEMLRALNIKENIDTRHLSVLINALFVSHHATRTSKNKQQFNELMVQFRETLEKLKTHGYESERMEKIASASYNRPDRDGFEPMNELDIARSFKHNN